MFRNLALTFAVFVFAICVLGALFNIGFSILSGAPFPIGAGVTLVVVPLCWIAHCLDELVALTRARAEEKPAGSVGAQRSTPTSSAQRPAGLTPPAFVESDPRRTR